MTSATSATVSASRPSIAGFPSDIPLDPMSMALLTMLEKYDPAAARLMALEAERQATTLELIASENHVSAEVMHSAGSWLTNKYAEGYPGKRYYGGCEFHDGIEDLARNRAKQLFGCNFANVQAHSGANANTAVFMAVFTAGPYFVYGPAKPKAVAAKSSATAGSRAASDGAASTGNSSPTAPAASGVRDAENAVKVMGLDETKSADPKKNPLDKPDIDKLLDGL